MMRLAFVIVIALLLLNGCRLSYRLQGQGQTAILIPPVSPITLKGTPSVLLARVSKARSHAAILNGCDIENDLLGLRWLGSTAEIRLTSESYFPEPGDERTEEVAPRVYLDSVQSVEAFRAALEDRVVRGCLRSDEAQALTRAIVERMPLPSMVGRFIRFGEGATGSVDLTPDFRLKVVGPVRSTDTTRDIVGYQIAWYQLTPAPKDARVKISLSSVSTGDKSTSGPIGFPASFQFFRLMFRIANSSTDHIATILGADDEATLDEAIHRFAMERDPSCETLSMPGVTCVMPAPEISINLEFPVSVNHRQVFVPLGGNLSNAMQSGKGAIAIPATLRIRRLFRGHLRTIKFEPTSQSLLRFVLMPGDEITW